MIMETLNEFTERFAKQAGCQWGSLSEDRNNLKKSLVKPRRGRNVLGWTRKFPKKRPGWFRVSTYAEWADNKAGIDAYEQVPRMHFNRDGLVYWIENGSIGPDFQNAARAVNSVLINPLF